MPTNGQFVVGEIVSAADANQYFSRGSRNMLINGDFRVAQRGTSFVAGANNDDTYNLDRWTLLSDGNDIVDVTQSTTAPTAGLYSIGLDVETVNKKFGILQIVEQRNIVGAIGQVVTLSFQARISGTSISNVKAVVLAWSGTADTVTSDVVSAWGADGVTPTWATNWTAENTPSNLAVTSSWATYRIQATIDTANTKNLAVFIWCDDTTTTLGDFLYITDVQLEIGAVASPFERRSYGEELALCQRYYYRWDAGRSGASVAVAAAWTEGSAYGTLFLPTSLRVAATSSSVSAQNVWVYHKYLASAYTSTAFSVEWTQGSSNSVEFNGGWSSTIYAGFIRTNTASAWWDVGAEL